VAQPQADTKQPTDKTPPSVAPQSKPEAGPRALPENTINRQGKRIRKSLR
jgi:hypothetical protein